jgi:hypothetical protein
VQAIIQHNLYDAKRHGETAFAITVSRFFGTIGMVCHTDHLAFVRGDDPCMSEVEQYFDKRR